MLYQEYRPHPSLASSIKCIWVLERDFDLVGGAVDLLPDSSIEILFNSGSDCVIDDGQTRQRLPPCYAMPLLHRPLRLSTTGVLKTIGVRFYAWGFAPVLNQPRALFQPLDSQWHILAATMRHVPTSQALQLLHTHLLHELKPGASHEYDVANASRRIYALKGSARIEALAESSFLSRRQLERKFKALLGLSPKALARQMRFEQVRDDLSRDPAADLSALALDYGYADQAHLNRDFKVFSHRTPAQFAAEIQGISADMRYGVAFPE
jgi:AraC-like DNA-binding protein